MAQTRRFQVLEKDVRLVAEGLFTGVGCQIIIISECRLRLFRVRASTEQAMLLFLIQRNQHCPVRFFVTFLTPIIL